MSSTFMSATAGTVVPLAEHSSAEQSFPFIIDAHTVSQLPSYFNPTFVAFHLCPFPQMVRLCWVSSQSFFTLQHAYTNKQTPFPARLHSYYSYPSCMQGERPVQIAEN